MRRFDGYLFDLMHVFQLVRDRTMDVSLIHAKIAKVLEKNKLGSDDTMYAGEVQLHIHQSSNLADVGVSVTTKSRIAQTINMF